MLVLSLLCFISSSVSLGGGGGGGGGGGSVSLPPPPPLAFWVSFYPTRQLVDVLFKVTLTYAN